MPQARRTLYRGLRLLGSPQAAALAVEDDRIVWSGPDAQADGLVDAATTVETMPGVLVTPGFVDAHVHLAMTGHALRGLDLAGARSRIEALERLRAHGETLGAQTVHGYGWDDASWPDGTLTGQDLDRVVPGRAVYLARVDAHSAVVSSALVARVPGLSDADGWRGDGLVERDAHHRVRDLVEQLPTPAERREILRTALRAASAAGIVAVHELAAPSIAPLDDLEQVAQMRAEETLPVVTGYWGAPDLDAPSGGHVVGLAGDFSLDGSLGSRTAALHAPYDDEPSTRGHLYLSAREVAEHVVTCTRAGLQAGFHVIGDRAVTTLVDGLRLARDEVGTTALRQARHRVEHLEMPSGADLELLGQLQVVASVQPAFDAAWGGDDGMYAARVGVDRARRMNPFATMARIGLTLAFGSDSPVTPLAPWAAVSAALAPRHGPGLDLETAVRAHTVGGWRAARIDDAGTLAAGSPAHLAFWSVPDGSDPAEASVAGQARCVRTVVAGRVGHDAEQSAATG